MKPIPFSIELWQQGYRPVTRDGREVHGLFWSGEHQQFIGYVGERLDMQQWYFSGKFLFSPSYESPLDIFLLPP